MAKRKKKKQLAKKEKEVVSNEQQPKSKKKKKSRLTAPQKNAQNLSERKTANHQLIGWLLFAFAFALYALTINHQYAFDDSLVLTENQFTQQGFAGILDLMSKDLFEGIYGSGGAEITGGRYRPLSLVSFAIEFQIFGFNPFVSHFINILFFALTAMLLYHVLRRWFTVPGQDFASAIPLVASLLFAAHPIHTEVVANIKSRDEILALLLLLSTFYYLHKAIEHNGWRPGWLILGGLSYFLSMLAKEHAFTFIVLIPALIWVFYKKDLKTIALRCSPLWGIALLYLMLRTAMVGGIAAETNPDLMENPFYGAAVAEKFGTIAVILLKYIVLLFFPHPLTADYSFNQIPLAGFGIRNPFAILGLLLYVSMAAYTLWRLPRRDILALCIALYFIPLSPVTNIFFNVGAPMGERFLYVPSLGFCIAVAYGLSKLLKHDSLLDLRRSTLVMGILCIVLFLFIIKTESRLPDWYDNESLFTKDVITSNNSAKANYYYGNTLQKKFIDRQSKDPNYSNPELLQKAEDGFLKAYEIYPEFHTAVYNLGLVNYYQKDAKNALKYWEATLDLRPGHSKSQRMLGILYARYLNDPATSIKYTQAIIDICDQNPEVSDCDLNSRIGDYRTLAIAYTMLPTPDWAKAFQLFDKALQLNPEDPNTWQNMAAAYGMMGDTAKAEEYMAKAKALGL